MLTISVLAMHSNCEAQTAVEITSTNMQTKDGSGSLEADAPAASASSTVEAQAAQVAEPVPQAVHTTPGPMKPKPGFFARWGAAYLMDWAGTTPTNPNAEQRRGTPPPIPSPPYPASDWPIGGTQEIGAPDYQTYMLQTAIDKDPIKLSKIK